jgi:uncharacterized protein YbaP (TraB family)
MITRKFATALISVLTLMLSTSLSAAPVWKVSKGDQVLYLAGTIHVLSDSDYPLPEAFDKAYMQADEVVFETDIDQLQSPEFQQYVLSQMLYQDGKQLDHFLSEETFQSLDRFCQQLGLPVQNMLGFKPGFVAVTLTVMELKRLNMAGAGVDDFYSRKAKQDGKPRGQLETAGSQVAHIANMGAGEEDALIRHMLADMELLAETMDETKAAWRSGDIKALETLLGKPLIEEFPSLYDSLLVQRNRLWMPQIIDMLATPETELVMVGALHLAGEEGLLHQLQARGFTTERLP